jgi:CRISPR/Cas system CSM-associated protein Csm3 (group 7 of RAMP superfamily)
MRLNLYIQLLSDTTFGRGEGVAGLVDVEVEYDPRTGLPYIGGRRIKGLLVESCADLLYAANSPAALVEAARRLFGETGSTDKQQGCLRVSRAVMPPRLQQAVAFSIQSGDLTPDEVFKSLTAIRRQTAINHERGAPERGSLRSMRVVVRGVTFQAPLELPDDDPQINDLQGLLAACARGVQRGGIGRNRGRGKINTWIESDEFMGDGLNWFETLLREARA